MGTFQVKGVGGVESVCDRNSRNIDTNKMLGTNRRWSQFNWKDSSIMFAELFNTILAKVYLKSVESESKILNDKLHLLKKTKREVSAKSLSCLAY